MGRFRHVVKLSHASPSKASILTRLRAFEDVQSISDFAPECSLDQAVTPAKPATGLDKSYSAVAHCVPLRRRAESFARAFGTKQTEYASNE